MMKIFGHFLVFTFCLMVGMMAFAISDYPNQRKIIENSGDKGMKAVFLETGEWSVAYGEIDGLSNPKVSESLKIGKGANPSSLDLGAPARLHK